MATSKLIFSSKYFSATSSFPSAKDQLKNPSVSSQHIFLKTRSRESQENVETKIRFFIAKFLTGCDELVIFFNSLERRFKKSAIFCLFVTSSTFENNLIGLQGCNIQLASVVISQKAQALLSFILGR